MTGRLLSTLRVSYVVPEHTSDHGALWRVPPGGRPAHVLLRRLVVRCPDGHHAWCHAADSYQLPDYSWPKRRA